MFRVNIVAVNLKDESLETPPIEAVVDTGSELTWLPRELLDAADIVPRIERTFVGPDGSRHTREVGYTVLKVDEHETIDEVVFCEPGDMTLLGVRTIEGFGVMVDNIGHRLVARSHIAASYRLIDDEHTA